MFTHIHLFVANDYHYRTSGMVIAIRVRVRLHTHSAHLLIMILIRMRASYHDLFAYRVLTTPFNPCYI
jgi:hypothetical protein